MVKYADLKGAMGEIQSNFHTIFFLICHIILIVYRKNFTCGNIPSLLKLGTYDMTRYVNYTSSFL